MVVPATLTRSREPLLSLLDTTHNEMYRDNGTKFADPAPATGRAGPAGRGRRAVALPHRGLRRDAHRPALVTAASTSVGASAAARPAGIDSSSTDSAGTDSASTDSAGIDSAATD